MEDGDHGPHGAQSHMVVCGFVLYTLAVC
jgi:hypothetical protein